MPVLRENLGSKRRVQIEARSRIAAFRAAETAIEMTPFLAGTDTDKLALLDAPKGEGYDSGL